MPSYTRRQLALLLLVVLVAGAGFGIGRWRQDHADLVEAFETFDQTPPESSAVARSSSRPEPARATSSKRSRFNGERSDPDGKDKQPAGPVDVNRATTADLRRLPGIGPVLAARIVEARESGGPFTSIDDLKRVSGIGKSKLERVRDFVTVSP